MNDLERRLEDLFMSDSRARRVERVNVAARRGTRLGALAFIGSVAALTLVLVVGFALLRGSPAPVPGASASPSASTAVAISPSPSASSPFGDQVMCGQVSQFTAATSTVAGRFIITARGESGNLVVIRPGTQMSGLAGYACVKVNVAPAAPSVTLVALLAPGMDGYVAESSAPTTTPRSSAPSSVKADSAHGLITFTDLRTEADPATLQSPRQFQKGQLTDFVAAVSPDGKRVAMFRAGETGQQLITFTTARPNDLTVYPGALVGSEFAVDIIWSGDNSDYIVYSVDDRSSSQTVIYSAIREYDLSAKKASEIIRANGVHLMPLAWRFDTHLGGAVEVIAPGGSMGSYYVIDGNSLTKRTPLVGQHTNEISASRDGKRIALAYAPAIRWWPVDQPSAPMEILPQSSGRATYAAFRPGTDELAVSVIAATAGTGVPPPGHFEIWNVNSGAQRVVSPTLGFQLWRADGSAAIDGSTLIDPDTGGTAQLPGGAFKIVATVLF